MLVITTGMQGSGKEVLLSAFAEAGCPVVRMGDVVRDHARESGAMSDDFSVGGHASSQRKEHGDEIWAVRTLERLPADGAVRVIDGTRSLFEVEYFKKHYPGRVLVVAVCADRDERFRRLRARNRADAPKDYEAFMSREERELGWGIGKAIAGADIIIDNNGTLDEFRANVRQVVTDIMEGRI